MFFRSCLFLSFAGCTAWADVIDEPPVPFVAPRCDGASSAPACLAEATAAERLNAAQQLTDEARAQVHAAVAQLQVDCPYTRASWQLPMALWVEAQRIDPAHVAPSHRAAWHALLADLERQVQTLDLIGADLALPTPGDHLSAHARPSALVTRASLALHADPIGQTLLLVRDNDRVVDRMTFEVQDRISRNNDAFYEHLGQTTMWRQTVRRHEALRRLAPHLVDDGARTRVDAMIRLLDEHEQHGC